jgi:hypothetical protein
MTDKTHDQEKLHTWAIRAVCEKMTERGFEVSVSEKTTIEIVISFTKASKQYRVTIPKQDDHDPLTACDPFHLVPFEGDLFDSQQREIANITLLGVESDEDGVKEFVERRIRRLFDK